MSTESVASQIGPPRFLQSNLNSECQNHLFVLERRSLRSRNIIRAIHKHTYLKGPYDKITSVAIPLALAVSSLYLIGRGIYNMSHGIGKKE